MEIPAEETVPMPSEASFGRVMAGACWVFFALIWVLRGHVLLWLVIVGGCFLLLSICCPVVLRPLNYLWFRLGLLLHLIVSPLIMGIVFFGVMTPFALVMRWFGHRFLDKDLEPGLLSYWKPKANQGGGARFGKQF
jgi:hypothetical protein